MLSPLQLVYDLTQAVTHLEVAILVDQYFKQDPSAEIVGCHAIYFFAYDDEVLQT